MNGKKLTITLVIFFLVQHVFPANVATEPCPLSPQAKVSPNEANILFRYIHDTIRIAIILYRLDVVTGHSKKSIIEDHGNELSSISKVKFDLEHIDIRKKGWTRYYPFSINGNDFLIRIFLTEERLFQPSAPVLYEGSIDNLHITFQILPPLKELLKGREAKPHNFSPASEVGRSV